VVWALHLGVAECRICQLGSLHTSNTASAEALRIKAFAIVDFKVVPSPLLSFLLLCGMGIWTGGINSSDAHACCVFRTPTVFRATLPRVSALFAA
jgi:hypothetical protein